MANVAMAKVGFGGPAATEGFVDRKPDETLFFADCFRQRPAGGAGRAGAIDRPAIRSVCT
ncbi:MAG: hypothetical protein EBZ59_04665 [Planctomycetia bacterium]|nr:hypothetical protein [Planctomycetia bacterium]